MAGHAEEHGGGHETPHLPDPSIWPLVVGLAAFALGLGLLWWIRSDDSTLSGPFLGVAATFTLISAAGWAYEDGRMKRKAELHEKTGQRQARFTQVVTFAVAEGELDKARSTGGVLTALYESDDSLRKLGGFQDLRIILSPAASGPTQVLVETTWAGREGLATYEETRGTLLDLINAHGDEVETGSTQVFDMEVLRDTKDVGFKMGLSAFVGVAAILVIGGLAVGGGLNLFAKDAKAGPTSTVVASTPEAPGTATLSATDNKFNKGSIGGAAAGQEFTVTFSNKGKVPHNLHFLEKKGGSDLAKGSASAIINGGETATMKFTVANAGTYYYQCDVHPDQMTGQFTVDSAGPPPAGK